MDGAQVGILEKSNQVSLGGFLKGLDSGSLETQVSLEVLSDLTDQTLEWQLSDEKLSGFLVSSDLTKSNSSWSVSVWFLDSTSGWGTLTSGLGSQLFSWSLTSSGFSGSLLGTSHFCLIF
jgi:histone H3